MMKRTLLMTKIKVDNFFDFVSTEFNCGHIDHNIPGGSDAYNWSHGLFRNDNGYGGTAASSTTTAPSTGDSLLVSKHTDNNTNIEQQHAVANNSFMISHSTSSQKQQQQPPNRFRGRQQQQQQQGSIIDNNTPEQMENIEIQPVVLEKRHSFAEYLNLNFFEEEENTDKENCSKSDENNNNIGRFLALQHKKGGKHLKSLLLPNTSGTGSGPERRHKKKYHIRFMDSKTSISSSNSNESDCIVELLSSGDSSSNEEQQGKENKKQRKSKQKKSNKKQQHHVRFSETPPTIISYDPPSVYEFEDLWYQSRDFHNFHSRNLKTANNHGRYGSSSYENSNNENHATALQQQNNNNTTTTGTNHNDDLLNSKSNLFRFLYGRSFVIIDGEKQQEQEEERCTRGLENLMGSLYQRRCNERFRLSCIRRVLRMQSILKDPNKLGSLASSYSLRHQELARELAFQDEKSAFEYYKKDSQ